MISDFVTSNFIPYYIHYSWYLKKILSFLNLYSRHLYRFRYIYLRRCTEIIKGSNALAVLSDSECRVRTLIYCKWESFQFPKFAEKMW